MTCLFESYDMQGFIDKNPGDDVKYEEWRRSDALVKGWMFGSLTEDVMGVVVGLRTAADVWKKLKDTYTHVPQMADNGKDLAEYIPLYRSIIGGDWETAKEHFNRDNNALSAKLNAAGHRVLQIPIAANLEFVKNLLKEIHFRLWSITLDRTHCTMLQWSGACGTKPMLVIHFR